MAELKEGEKAPDFKIPNEKGKPTSPSDFRGEWLVLYFYPKDMTPGCTTESIDFSKRAKSFKKLNAVVVGVSCDSVERHQKFIDVHDLEVSLLSDADIEVCKLYGVYKKKSLYGRQFMGIVRTTFIIDPKGKITKIFHKVKVKDHAETVLEFIKERSR